MNANLNTDLDDQDRLLLAALGIDPSEPLADRSDRLTGSGPDQHASGPTAPLPDDIEAFVADTVSTKLLQVVARLALAGRGDEFSVDTVVDESVAEVVDVLGEPTDRELLREGVREYIHEVHAKHGVEL